MRLATFAAVVCVSACGLTDSGPSEGQFCSELARRECAAVAGKCVVVSQPACENLRRTACEEVTRAAKAAGRSYDADRADECLKRVQAAFAGSVLRAAELDELNTVCGRAFGGNVRELGACKADVDCTDGLSCAKGVCARRKVVSAGGFCGNPGEVCPTDQYCAATAAGPLACMARKDRGAACGAAEPCKDGLRCVGTCMEAMAVGAACQPRSEGRLWAGTHEDCATSYCDPFLRVCAQGLSFAGDSSSCRAYAGNAPDAGAPDSAP